jgi:hypothetical protein
MYRPNFCAECGEKIIRLRWRVWTNRTFCDSCAKRFRKQRLKASLVSTTLLLIIGFVSGRAGRPRRPPLTIERSATSISEHPAADRKPNKGSEAEQKIFGDRATVANGPIYICGARTRKGRPCSRRVQALVRCWQHLGLPAMLPTERLSVKD